VRLTRQLNQRVGFNQSVFQIAQTLRSSGRTLGSALIAQRNRLSTM